MGWSQCSDKLRINMSGGKIHQQREWCDCSAQIFKVAKAVGETGILFERKAVETRTLPQVMRTEEAEGERSQRKGGMELVQRAEQGGLRIHSELHFEGHLFHTLDTLISDLLTVHLSQFVPTEVHIWKQLPWSGVTTSTGLLLLRHLCKAVLGLNCSSPTLVTLHLLLLLGVYLHLHYIKLL